MNVTEKKIEELRSNPLIASCLDIMYERGCEQGKADERQRIINMLKSKAWVEDEHAHLLYDSVLVPISAIMSEIVDEIENK